MALADDRELQSVVSLLEDAVLDEVLATKTSVEAKEAVVEEKAVLEGAVTITVRIDEGSRVAEYSTVVDSVFFVCRN